MLNTDWQKQVLAARRERRDMLKAGWEWVGEGGGLLWELERGSRWNHRIVEAKVGRSGKGVWVRIEPKESITSH